MINVFAFFCLIAAFLINRDKAVMSLKVAVKSFIKLFPTVLVIIILIGLLMGFVSPEKISVILGEGSGIWGIAVAATVGTVMHIPAIIAFPMAASLLDSGASVMSVAGFITTLTMIGIVTLPMEIKELGGKLALLRNGMSFIAAVIIALLLGWVL